MITISNGHMLMSVEGTNREENYSGLVKRQINYITKVSMAKMNNPGSVSPLSGLRKPHIRF